MKLFIKGLMFLAILLFSIKASTQSGSGGGSGSGSSTQVIPELIFQNPVLVSGVAGQDGAIYKFSNVSTGIDAKVKIRKRSSSAVTLTNIDVSDKGWTKAFQPQLGIAGNVPANQNWWMEFEMSFFKTGTNDKKKMQKFFVTALDVDGDNVSIREYVQMEGISKVSYCPITYLTESPVTLITSLLPTSAVTCGECGKTSPLVTCSNCNGSGMNGTSDCSNCKGSGKLHDDCDHAWQSNSSPLTGYNALGQKKMVQGPVMNFFNIDTAGTQVMSTYEYADKDVIRFTIGGQSGTVISNAGERLNSLWFKEFSLAPPPMILPVKLSSFNAQLDRKNVTLSWTSAIEENFSHYVLERSTDGKNFSEVAVVFAYGNTTSASDYRFKDVNVSSASNVIYYRLRMVEMSKEASYSEVRVIRLGKEEAEAKLTTYPNPVADQLRVTFPNAWQGKEVMVQLLNANGASVQTIRINSASQTENIRMSGYARGLYVVKAVCGEQMLQERVIKN